jgi:hypothetical protein
VPEVFQHVRESLVPLFACSRQVNLQKMKIELIVNEEIQTEQFKTILASRCYLVLEYN